MKYLTSIWSVLIVLGLCVTLKVTDPYLLERVRLINFDMLQSTLPVQPVEDVVLIDIGEHSLEQYGQWPWPRATFAQMIADLRNANAGMIGFTVMFPEADRFGQDDILASWIQDNGILLAQTGSTQGRSDVAPFVGTVTLGDGDPYNFVNNYTGIVTNIASLETVAWGAGHINATVERDNVTRRIPLLIQVNNQLYPSFALEMIRANAGLKSYTVRVEPTGIENIRIPPFEPFVTDVASNVWLNYNNTFTAYEYGSELPDLNGATVIVGVTAEGIVPLVATPQGNQYPHTLQAALIANLMSGDDLISRPIWVPLAELMAILLGGLLIIVSVYYTPVLISGLISLIIAAIAGYIPLYLFDNFRYLMDFSWALSTFILVFAHGSFNNFYIQFKLRQQIKKQFETYLDPRQVALLQKNPNLLKLGGERKEMTFMFMDIVGFTPISEHYKNNDDPEGLVELINMFLTRMTDIILKHGGCIDKYMGDCIMAFWNAPIDCPNHAELAVKAAAEIIEEGKKIKDELAEKHLPNIGFGIGINTGTCIVGNMGSTSRFDYSVIGDAVNLASRLEGQTRNYDHEVLLSSFTAECLPGTTFQYVDSIQVKGKSEPVSIYTLQ